MSEVLECLDLLEQLAHVDRFCIDQVFAIEFLMLHRLVPFGFQVMRHSQFVLDLAMRRVLSLLCQSASLVLEFVCQFQ